MSEIKTLQPDNIVEGKSADRVPSYYRKYQEEFNAQYNMLLPDGITCAGCVHSEKCKNMFGGKDTNLSCQFYPSRFYPN